jgi:hypothetical protein
MGAALAELVTINSLQVLSGAVVSLLLCQAILKAYPDIKFLQPRNEGVRLGVLMVVVAGLVLAGIVGVYLMTGISP